MTTPAKGSCLVAWAVTATLIGSAARAAEAPLLVVVEAAPALDADAAEIRRAIGAELRCQTIAPMKTTAEPPERALIVALDSERIAVSLRSGDGTPVTRIIPAPADPAARVRVIAWLAGNLARDQVTPIIAEGSPEPSPSPTVLPLPATAVATEPPPASTASPTAVASSPLPTPSAAGGATISLRAEPRSPPGPLLWSISGSIGPVIAGFERAPIFVGRFSGLQPGVAWQVTLQRRREHERLVIGGTLEGTHNQIGDGDPPQLIGANIFVGAAWHYRLCNLEATIGAGPEAGSILQYGSLTVGNQTTTSPYYSYHFDLYAQGTIAAAVPLSDSIEALVQVGFHATSTHEETWFAVSTIGLRYLLP